MSETLNDDQQRETLQATIRLTEAQRASLLEDFEKEKRDQAWIDKLKTVTAILREHLQAENSWIVYDGIVEESCVSPVISNIISDADETRMTAHGGKVYDLRSSGAYDFNKSVIRDAFPTINEEALADWNPVVLALNIETGKVLVSCVSDETEDGEPKNSVWFVVDPNLAEQQVQAEVVPNEQEDTHFKRLAAQLV